MSTRGLVLFAHGARDPRWAEPFEQVRSTIAKRRPDLDIRIAYLEHLQPSLAATVAAMAEMGVQEIRLVPMFFGRGGHLREDFPRAVVAARAAAPNLRIEISEAAGEAPAVREALADFALHGW